MQNDEVMVTESAVPPAGSGRLGSWVLLAYRLPREPSNPRVAVWRGTDSMGHEVWDHWCANLPGYNAERNRKKWHGFGQDHDNPITVGTLIAEARANGYRPPDGIFQRHTRQLARRLASARFYASLPRRPA